MAKRVAILAQDLIWSDRLARAVEAAEDPYLALVLSRMFWPDFPVPVGVFRAVTRPTHDQLIEDQLAQAVARAGAGQLDRVLNGGETWTVE